MTPEVLSSLSAAAWSLVLAYVPGIKQWYDSLTTERRPVVFAVLVIVTACAIFGFSCAGWFGFSVPCTEVGVQSLLVSIVMALATGGGFYTAVIRPNK
jgi:hypothetical protein